MSYIIDVRDWVGGWPLEFSTTKAVCAFFEARGFSLKNISEGEANTEYLFEKTSA